MKLFKTLKELQEYNNTIFDNSPLEYVVTKNEKTLDIDGLSYFERITQNSQPHHFFNLEWNTYYPDKFADTFLPKAEGYQCKATRFYDGAEILSNLKSSPRKLLPLTDSNKLIANIVYTFPKGVEASRKKNRVQPNKYEIATFIEVDEQKNISVSFKAGSEFKSFLSLQKIPISSVEGKNYNSSTNKIQKHFGNKLSHENMMDFILKTIGINTNTVYGNTKKGELEALLRENKVESFIYKNICNDNNMVVIKGTIIKGWLELKYIDNSTIDEITNLQLSKQKSGLAFKQNNVWSASCLAIPFNYNNEICPENTVLTNEKEIYHIAETVTEHFNFSKLKGAEKQYAQLNNEIQKQLNNPFYDDVNLCVNLTMTKTSKSTTTDNDGLSFEPLDGNSNQSINIPPVNNITNTYSSNFKKNDKPCDITLNITVDNNGELSIKHIANPNYLKEFEGFWEEEIKKRGLQDEIDIKELRQQVLDDFTSKKFEGDMLTRFVQDAKAFLSEDVGGYIEAIHATQKVAMHVWDTGTINRGLWHSTGNDAEEYKNLPSYMHLNGYVGGAVDGFIDEIAGIPMALKEINKIVTDPKQREALAQVFTKDGFGQLMDELSKQAGEIEKDLERSQHFAGQTTISVGSMMLPGMQITKLGVLSNTLTGVKAGLATITSAKVLEILDTLRKANRYKPEILKAIEDFMKELDPKIIGKIADKPGFDKVLKEMAQQWRKFHGSKFMFKHLEGKGDDFIKKIKEFEAKVFDDANFTADVKLIDGFLEYKSWKKNTFNRLLDGNQAKKQLKNYLKSGNFEYVIDKAKLLKDGITNADEFVKEKFQKVFQNNAENWFKSIENGGELLNKNELIKIFETDNLLEIKLILNDVNSSFYKKIITVE